MAGLYNGVAGLSGWSGLWGNVSGLWSGASGLLDGSGASPPTSTFTALASDDTSYTVPRDVLDSAGTSYAVPQAVLSADGTSYNVI